MTENKKAVQYMGYGRGGYAGGGYKFIRVGGKKKWTNFRLMPDRAK